ncbi:alpha/beta fold hydrolase [Nocardioides marinquilinus]|uniref:Alpha/beta fold hydrolase n=1 Tax=Nocardioides marinquilinus TaxID=1210400 RepID=A0ABP9PPT5_9ACTN
MLVCGMNHGGWWYEPLAERLEAHGHTAVPLTLTGLEPTPDHARTITLDTHVADVVRAVDETAEPGVRDVVLVGHSYGGLPITGAADARADVVSALVYLDAFLPEDGDSGWALTNDDERAWYVADSRRLGHAVDPLPFFDERARPHPVATLHQALRLTGAWRSVPTKVYVEALDWPGESPHRQSIDRAAADPQFVCHAWDTRHNVMHDGPDRVLALLRGLV